MKRNNNQISNLSNVILNVIFIIWSLLCVIPFLLAIGVSFTSQNAIDSVGYRIIPAEFSTVSYDFIFLKSNSIIRALGITLFVTVLGTILSLIVTALFAYPLSRRYFRFRNLFSFIVFFTLIFQGGAVANYMVYTQILHLKNNIFVYILPSLANAWNIILLRTFITASVPDDLVDSAKIDGANEWQIFLDIVAPLSKPGIATISLFVCIGIWNDWYTPSLYISDSKKYNLQYMLNSMISGINYLKSNISNVGGDTIRMLSDLPSEGVCMAMCIITIFPIVVAYPYFQRYFVKGLTIGAVKG